MHLAFPVLRSTSRTSRLLAAACLLGGTPAVSAQGAPGDTVGARWVEASDEGPVEVQVIAHGLGIPSTLAFLPDGTLLVGDRHGRRLLHLDLTTGAQRSIAGLPAIWVDPKEPASQGAGLHHVLLAQDFASSRRLFISYTELREGGSVLAIDAFRLDQDSLASGRRLFTTPQPLAANNDHFGGRLVERDGYLWITYGERFSHRDSAQRLTSPYGKVFRIHTDGRIPRDNPFANRKDAHPAIWSLGHRNPLGLAFHPVTGALWSHENGPRGGDEVNVIRRGANYGWPLVTWGEEYEGGPVGAGLRSQPGLVDPVYYFKPSIAPSDMAFHSGRGAPHWRGNLFVGALGRRFLGRLVLGDERVLHEERLLADRRWRVRSLAESPDGSVYVGVDSGLLVRVRLMPRT